MRTDPKPAGFGQCGRCAYRATGTAEICFTCATPRLEQLGGKRCAACDGSLGAAGSCGNPLCNRSIEERCWESIRAIAVRSGPLQAAINTYKYDDKHGWGLIFARVLIGYLDAHRDAFMDVDAIIPMPTYVGAGGRSRDHIRFIIERAALEAPDWPFRLDAMRRTGPAPRLADVRTFKERAIVAETEIGPALEVIDAEFMRGARVVVFDDVVTSGLTLREVARKLRTAGALRVSGIALARQRYRRRTA